MTKKPKIFNVPFSADFINVFAKFIAEANYSSNDIIILPTQRICRKIERELCNTSSEIKVLPNLITFSSLVSNSHLFLDSCPNLNIHREAALTNLELLFQINTILEFDFEDFFHAEELLKFINKIYTFADAEQISQMIQNCDKQSITKICEYFNDNQNLPSQISKKVCEEIANTFTQSLQRIIFVLPTEPVPYIDNLIKNLLSYDGTSLIITGFNKQNYMIQDPAHPQNRINNFLSSINFEIETIKDLQDEAPNQFIDFLCEPEAFVSPEKLKFQHSDISLIECDTLLQESQINALIIREHLELGFKKIAVISEDAFYNKLLKKHLSQWDIIANDTNDLSLDNSRAGSLISSVVEIIKDPIILNFLEVLKHPLSKFLNQDWHEIESNYFRKINASLDPDIFNDTQLHDVCNRILNFPKGKGKFQSKFEKFKSILESISDIEVVILQQLEEKSQNFPLVDISNQGFFFYVNKILRSLSVAEEDYAMNDQLTITSLLEARNIDFDLVIIPNLNDPYPRPSSLKKFLPDDSLIGMNIPNEESLSGLFSYDLNSHLRKRCFFTRAKKIDGADQIPALLFEKVDVIHKMLSLKEDTSKYHNWLEKLNEYDEQKITQPLVNPPSRMRRISVSGVEKLIENPYGFYANYVLKLKKIDPISPSLEARDFGNFLHNAISLTHYADGQTQDDYISKFKQNFINEVRPIMNLPQVLQYWMPKIINISGWLYNYESENFSVIQNISKEESFRKIIAEVEVLAKCDRVEFMGNGRIKIIDYKTGDPPSAKNVQSGKFPQLPMEALLIRVANQNEFEFEYHCLKGNKIDAKVTNLKVDLQETQEGLVMLLNKFLNSSEPFFATCDESSLRKTLDYVHLSRIREWLN